MIHIVTQHFGTQAWFEIQKNHIEKYTPDKSLYKVYLLVYKTTLPENFEVPSNYEVINLDEKEGLRNDHYAIVEECYDRFIKEKVEDDDIVIYMDNDAFPIDGMWSYKIMEYLQNNHICAVHRYEDRGMAQPDQYYPYPHLCFYSFKKKDREQYGFVHEIPPGYPCPGFTINDLVKEKGLNVKELVRTNKFNHHPTMFGVYDDLIYHQSCGSRAIVGRPYATISAQPDTRKMCYEGIDFYDRQEAEAKIGGFIEGDVNDINLKVFDIVYNKIESDTNCDWIRRYYIGKF
tara:strand:+ start:32949 stop:33815 length:867 start_codon:yes stop_codon:yes gene_type:complete